MGPRDVGPGEREGRWWVGVPAGLHAALLIRMLGFEVVCIRVCIRVCVVCLHQSPSSLHKCSLGCDHDAPLTPPPHRTPPHRAAPSCPQASASGPHLTVVQFFSRYPSLQPILLAQLQAAAQQLPGSSSGAGGRGGVGEGSMHPSLQPILSLLARLRCGVCMWGRLSVRVRLWVRVWVRVKVP